MKGVVFNLFEAVVRRHHGEDAWDSLLETAQLGGSYTSLGSYPDDDMLRLLDAGAGAFDMTRAQMLSWFGREAMPVLAQRYSDFFTAQTSTRSFVISVNDIIHPEVRKIYPGADVPVFDFSDAPDGALMMGYESARKFCALAEGFVQGAAAYYCEEVDFQHVTCMHRGDAKCLFRLTFSPSRPS